MEIAHTTVNDLLCVCVFCIVKKRHTVQIYANMPYKLHKLLANDIYTHR